MNHLTNNTLQEDLNLYNELKSYAYFSYKTRKYEKALKYAYYAASYAWVVHFGLWCDDDLENLLVKIGEYVRKKFTKVANKNPKKENYKIAYVASILRDVGGHNILLKHWVSILSDKYHNQDLYITKPDKNPLIYDNLKKSLIEKGVKIFELENKISFLDRIKRLIKLIEDNSPDVLILFTHPNDVTIIPALTALSNRPFTIFFNHADHTFWLGKKISDCIIEQRLDGAKFSRKFREIKVNQYIIPLTTDIRPQKVSKEKLGIPENSTLSISIGGIMKVTIPSDYSYYETIKLILEKYPNHYHMFITDYPPKETPKEFKNCPDDLKKRFIIDGPFPNLEPIYGVGDFLIDTFPIGGGMVMVDAMACGLPIVAFHKKSFSIISDGGGELPNNYPFLTYNYNEFLNNIFQLIENPETRKEISNQLNSFYNKNLSPEVVRGLLFNIIDGNVKETDVFDYSSFDLNEFNYNIESGQRAFLTERKNFLLIDLSYQVLTLKQRLRIFKFAVKRKEFKSKTELVVFSILAIFRKFVSILYNPLYDSKRKRKFLLFLS